MKEISIVTLLSVAAIAAAPARQEHRPTVYATSKPTEAFASCFTRSEEQRGAAWWFVPREHGGTLSNLGNRDGAAAYFVAIDDQGARRVIKLDERGRRSSARLALEECL